MGGARSLQSPMRVKILIDAISAFTQIELMVTIAIVCILAATGLLAWQPLIARAESVKCLTHMRSLHTSLVSYVQDVGHWPQEPDTGNATSDIDADWWIHEMASYGATEQVWICPTIKRAQLALPENQRWRIHYSPGMFGPLPSDPYKFSTQPWLVEVVGMHGHGPNICFPDGSIRPLDDLMDKK